MVKFILWNLKLHLKLQFHSNGTLKKNFQCYSLNRGQSTKFRHTPCHSMPANFGILVRLVVTTNQAVDVLRPVYTGDFCCDFSCDFLLLEDANA